MSVMHARVLGLLVVTSLGMAARLPQEPFDAAAMARRFAFESVALDYRVDVAPRQTRDVHRDLQRIRPWIASVGAAAAMGDVDGNLRADDACLVDTRTDTVLVAPLMGARYSPFVLVAPSGQEASRTIAPMGCLIADLNEDGLPDLLVYYWGRPPVAFLRRDTGAHTLDEPPSARSFAAVPIAGEQRWFTNAALLADVDGDGHADLVIGNYFCDDGRILDGTTTLPVCPHPVMQDSMSRAYNGGRNRILRWVAGGGGQQPTVAFADVAEVFTDQVARGWTLAVAAQDLNGDGLPDLYFANDFGPDRLLVNCSRSRESFGASRAELGCLPRTGPIAFRQLEGQRRLADPRSKVLGQDSFKGMGVDFADLNGDGIADIYVSNITETWALQESQFLFVSDGRRIDTEMVRRGVAPYTDDSEALGVARSGWAWDARLADFDNDGIPEAVQALGFVRGRQADAGLVWRKSCWAMLQELATANDGLLRHPMSWFQMEQGDDALGCDISGNTRRNPFFVRSASGPYVDVSGALGHLAGYAPAPTRGLAIGDADQDGRLDYIEARQFASAMFHHNRSDAAPGNTFVGLSVRFMVTDRQRPASMDSRAVALAAGMRSRPAIGAQVQLRLSDARQFVSQVDGGNGHSGKRGADLHFGLGAVAPGTGAEVTVSWISSSSGLRTQRFVLPALGQHYVVLLPP